MRSPGVQRLMPKSIGVEITRAEFCAALKCIHSEINEGQWAMLRAHFLAPGCELTASKLAREAGYKNYRGTNLRYGKLGTLLREALGLPRAQGHSPQLIVFAWIVQWHPGGDYGLRLRPASFRRWPT
jgi:hypothetical protein